MRKPAKTPQKRVDLATPPAHLSPEARELWHRLLDDFHLGDAAGLALVRTAAEAFDRAEAARRSVAAEGAVQRDRFGQLKVNPAAVVERDARALLVSALRAMRLQPGDVGVNDDLNP